MISVCKSYPSLVEGKDCDAEKGFVNVDFASHIVPTRSTKMLYISFPREEDGVPASETRSIIHSDIVSGLQLDFVKYWQMNARIHGGESSSPRMGIYRLFWVSCRPGALSKVRSKFTPEFQDYDSELFIVFLIAMALYALVSTITLALMLYASSCLEYMAAVGKAYDEPIYI